MKCPKCGSKEIDAEIPYTVYRCGSRDYDQRPNTFIQSSDCKEYEKGKKLFTKIKYAFKIIFGKLRCSGYGVYPNGIKCFGCSDCKKVK